MKWSKPVIELGFNWKGWGFTLIFPVFIDIWRGDKGCKRYMFNVLKYRLD